MVPTLHIYSPKWLKGRYATLLIATSVLLPILVINPFREMLSQDDSWAYARMVQHLLRSGEYRLDAWSAANMPVQIYVAAAASKLFGYSFSVLRCTTLLLFLLAVGSFYMLLRELGHGRTISALITTAFVASPLVLTLSFTFMSDVQFLGWFVLSLWLYVRGITRHSLNTVLVASTAAGLAIGTRQFGIAVIVGYVGSWLLCRREDRYPFHFVVAGTVVPMLASVAQVLIGLRRPNFTQAYRITEVHLFLATPISSLVAEFAWRLIVILQYSGMCLAPLLPILLTPGRVRNKWYYAWMLAGCLIVAAILIMGSPLTARPEAQHHGLWEPLELYWLLPTVFARLRWAMRLLDLCGVIGAGCMVWMALRASRSGRCRTPAFVLLSSTAGSLVLLHLVYVQLNDTYITPLIPFVLLLAATALGSEVGRAAVLTSCLASLAIIAGTSVWVRADYSRQQAAWSSADKLVRAGVSPSNIAAPLHWAEYHGAFDDWVAAGAPGFDASQPSSHGKDALHDPFYRWFNERSVRSDYRLLDSMAPYDPAIWQPTGSTPYWTARFTQHQLLTLRRR